MFMIVATHICTDLYHCHPCIMNAVLCIKKEVTTTRDGPAGKRKQVQKSKKKGNPQTKTANVGCSLGITKLVICELFLYP